MSAIYILVDDYWLDMDVCVQNNGEAAGQTVFHFHMHIIPRYENDTVNIGWKPGSITDERIKEIKNKINGGM